MRWLRPSAPLPPHRNHRFRHEDDPEFLCVFSARTRPSPSVCGAAPRQWSLGRPLSALTSSPTRLVILDVLTACSGTLMGIGGHCAVCSVLQNQIPTGSGKSALIVTAGQGTASSAAQESQGLKDHPKIPRRNGQGIAPAGCRLLDRWRKACLTCALFERGWGLI